MPKDVVIKPCKLEEVKVKSEHKPAKMTKGDNAPKQTKDEGKFVDLPGQILKFKVNFQFQIFIYKKDVKLLKFHSAMIGFETDKKGNVMKKNFGDENYNVTFFSAERL